MAVAVYDASDDDFRAVYMNPSARDLTGTPGDIAGRRFVDLYPGAAQGGAVEIFRQVRTTGVKQSSRQYVGPSGRTWNFDTFLIDGAGETRHLVAVGAEELSAGSNVDLETLIASTQSTWLPASPRDLARLAAEQGAGIVEGVECMITFISAEAPDTLEIVAGSGPWAQSLIGRTMAAAGTFSGQAIAQRASIETTDALSNSTARVHLEEGRMDTLRVVPLSIGDPLPDGRGALGVIGFYRRGQVPFKNSERRLMDEFGRWITLSIHRAELLEEAQQVARRLKMGVDLALDLGTSLDSRTVIDRLLLRALDAVSADNIGLSRIDGDSVVIEGVLDRDPGYPSFAVGARVKIFSSLFLRMVADKTAVAESYDAAEFPVEMQPFARSLRHSITVPLVHGGVVFAALAASRREDRPFRSEEMAVLQELGAVAGLALRNADLFTEVESSRDRARAIARSLRLGVEVAVDLSSQLDPEEVIRRLLRRVTTAVGADRGTLSLVDGESVVVMDSHALSGTAAEPGARWAAGPGSLVGEAIRTQRPTQVSVGDPNYESTQQVGGISHGLAVPLAVQGEVLYVLGLGRNAGRPFSEEEIATLQQVGNVAVLSLRNAQLYRAKTDFMNLAAHELRTPLAVLNGYVSMLQDGTFGPPSEAWQPPIAVLAGKTRELGQLVENLLVGARLESGLLAGARTALDLGVLVGEAISRAQARLALLGGRLSVSLPADSIVVTGDAEQLARILDNLINNALTYSDSGPAVAVTLSGGERAEVTVSDSGRGIPPDLHERVFEQFYRVEEQDAGNPSGTGLGLYISRQLAVRHGGTLTIVSSEPGKGSVFALRLPLAKS